MLVPELHADGIDTSSSSQCRLGSLWWGRGQAAAFPSEEDCVTGSAVVCGSRLPLMDTAALSSSVPLGMKLYEHSCTSNFVHRGFRFSRLIVREGNECTTVEVVLAFHPLSATYGSSGLTCLFPLCHFGGCVVVRQCGPSSRFPND